MKQITPTRRLYDLVDRIQKHYEWKYPQYSKWNNIKYTEICFAWIGLEDELIKKLHKLESDPEYKQHLINNQ